MEPKEKAKDLIEKYLKLNIEIGKYDIIMGYLTMKMHDAKQCALIAVEEIIKYQDSLIGMLDTNDGTNPMFWENVKQEIDKL